MKNVLITGSTRGIGLAIKNEMQELGHRVFGCSSKDFDLSCTKNAELLYDAAKKELGSVDILINNAGRYIYNPIEKMTQDEIEQLINLNFHTPYVLCKLTAGDMKKNKWGRIINIGSISGVVGEANASLYSATKSALSGLTKSLALELAADNITINQINPGWVNTDLAANALNEEEKRETLDVIPQKRFVEPYEVAKLCTYLISDEAKGLTGQCINLCAGLSCGC